MSPKPPASDDPDGYYGLGVIWADFNNTGRPDIYVANDSTPKFLYKNRRQRKIQGHRPRKSGTAVSEDGSEQASMGIAVGDYNHTGRPSLYVTNFADENNLLYRNDGNWNFTEVSYPSGVALPSLPCVKWGTAFVDLDNDGWLDLITVERPRLSAGRYAPVRRPLSRAQTAASQPERWHILRCQRPGGPGTEGKPRLPRAWRSAISSTTATWTSSSATSTARP